MANTIARWLFNENSSGITPTTAADDFASNDLTIDMSGSTTDAQWTSNVGGNGLSFYGTTGTTSDNAAAYITDIVTNGTVGSSLNGVNTCSLILRCANLEGMSSATRAFFIGDPTGNGDFAVCLTASQLTVRWDNDTDDASECFIDLTMPSVLTTIAINIDTTQASGPDRCKIHLNGSATPESYSAGQSTVYLAQNSTLSLATTDNLAFGNDALNGNRATEGDYFYAELFDAPLTTQEISDSHTALVSNNDIDWASAEASAALTGTTVVGGVLESEIVAGSETIIITLTNDTWVAAGTGPIGSTADTQAIIDGLTAASSPTNGWNNEVRDKEVTTAVVRTSNTVATITLTAQAGYNVLADEIITATIPAAALVTSATPVVATPTITVTDETIWLAEVTVNNGENLTGLDYRVFSGHDIETMTPISSGNGETTDGAGLLSIDITADIGALVETDPLIILIGDWTTAPSGSSNAAICYTTVSVG